MTSTGGDDRAMDRDDPVPADSEGPLAFAARAVSEHNYLHNLDRLHREGWDRASGGHPEALSKRWLVSLSHAIEKSIMSGPPESPTVVVAMFQRLEFFDREREVYARMAAAGLDVLIGFVEGEAHQTPPGVTVVLLGDDEPLADEWTVIAVGPRAGAFLVATDQHRFDPAERGYQASRQFHGRWGFSTAQAAGELARLRFALGERLPGTLRRKIDELLAHVMPTGQRSAASYGTPGEAWATTALYHLIDRMQSARAGNRDLREQLADAEQAAAARGAAAVDSASGLPTSDLLDRWTAPEHGATTLPVGVALFDVPGLDENALGTDRRASYLAAHRVAAAVTLPLGPADAAVRLSAREFLLLVPGASSRHLAGMCDQVAEGLELSAGGYPNVSLRAAVATITTRARPFPLADLRDALTGLDPNADDLESHGPFDAGTTPGGERILVATTALHARLAPRLSSVESDPAAELPQRTAQAHLRALIGTEHGDDVFATPSDAGGL